MSVERFCVLEFDDDLTRRRWSEKKIIKKITLVLFLNFSGEAKHFTVTRRCSIENNIVSLVSFAYYDNI